MRIIVCVKQVPSSNEIKMDKETNTIIREGAEAVLNPFDSYAIEEALKMKDKFGGTITAISMGIPKVAELLKEVMELGVDAGVLLSDRAFAGADSLATAYTLSRGIKKIGEFDLIICGKQATDGDTAQVGPSLGEKLDIPHTTYVSNIEEIKDGYIRCRRGTDNGYELLEIKLPAIITVLKDINVPRLPSIKTIKNAQLKSVSIWNALDIDADLNCIGLGGSPTQVVNTFIPENSTEIEMLEGTTEIKAAKLVDKLELKLISMGLQDR
jgi:electron transfer flavoprotein beta subunit